MVERLAPDDQAAIVEIVRNRMSAQRRAEIAEITPLSELAFREGGAGYGVADDPHSEVDIGAFISRDSEIRGGRPRITGTGVTVQRIVGWYQLGLVPEEIAVRIGHLSLAQVHAALAYYHANRDAVQAAMTRDEAAGERAEQERYGLRQAS